MPIPEKYLADFEENGIYHVYNRTNNKERLFLTDENHHFFLRKYAEYLSPVLDTYCWCLLPTHFHLLVRTRSEAAIRDGLERKGQKELLLTEKRFMDKLITTGELTEQSFKRFFQSYAQSFNKVYNRNGNLFYKPFKRVAVQKDSHFTRTVVYIHANPLKHKIVKDFTQYKWSSWHSVIADAPTQLLRQELIEWFGSKEQFVKAHKDLAEYYYKIDNAIED
jgi:REP element-mobilizing transposase RayT